MNIETSFFPPIILSLGGLLPVLVGLGVRQFGLEWQALVSVLYLILVWIVFFLAKPLIIWSGHSSALTLISLTGSLALVVLWGILLKFWQSKDWQKVVGAFVFSLAIASLTLAVTSYVGVEPIVVVIVKYGQPLKAEVSNQDESPARFTQIITKKGLAIYFESEAQWKQVKEIAFKKADGSSIPPIGFSDFAISPFQINRGLILTYDLSQE